MKKFILSLLLLAQSAFAVTSSFTDVQSQYLPAQNQITNPGFENGLYNWSAVTGTLVETNNIGAVGYGKAAAIFTPSGQASAMRSNAYTLSQGLYGGSCLARVLYRGGANNYTFSVLNGFNSVIAGTSLLASSAFTRQGFAFSCPTSGVVKAQITNFNGASTSILIDDVYIGENFTNANGAGYITNPIAGAVVGEEWARADVTCASGAFPFTCALSKSTPGIASIQETAAGAYSVNFVGGTWSEAPSCIVVGSNAVDVCTSNASTPTTSVYKFNCYAPSSSIANDGRFTVRCIGNK